MNNWGAITWEVARAGGFTAYALLTVSVALGLALSLHLQAPRWPRLINNEMHTFVTVLALIFTGIHVLAVWIDPFTRFDWYEVFLPFTSHYRPLWIALGIVGWYLGLAVGLSVYARRWIGYAWWRRLHVLTFGVYALTTAHGLATGSDTRTAWGLAIYGMSALLVTMLLWLRFLRPATPRERAHPALAWLTVALAIAAVWWTAAGPAQVNWNTLANNGNGSGARAALVSAAGPTAGTPSTTLANPFTSPLSARFQGTLTQTGPDATGSRAFQLDATVSGDTTLVLRLRIQEQQVGGGEDDDAAASGRWTVTGSRVRLGTQPGAPIYDGQLTSFDERGHMQALVSAQGATPGSLQVSIRLRGLQLGAVGGSLQITPAS